MRNSILITLLFLSLIGCKNDITPISPEVLPSSIISNYNSNNTMQIRPTPQPKPKATTKPKVVKTPIPSNANSKIDIDKVNSISVDTNFITLKVGETASFKATVLMNDNTKHSNVKVNILNTQIINLIDNFKIEAKSEGLTKIEITDLFDSSKKAIIDVSVIKKDSPVITVDSISLLEESISLNVNDKKKLVATVKLSDGTKNNLVNWSSPDSTIASVDQEGNILALKSGQITITASSKNDPNKKISAYITINNPNNSNEIETTQTPVPNSTSSNNGLSNSTKCQIESYEVNSNGNKYTQNYEYEYDSLNRLYKTRIKTGDSYFSSKRYEYLSDGTLVTYNYDFIKKLEVKESESIYKDNDYFGINKLISTKYFDLSGNIVMTSNYEYINDKILKNITKFSNGELFSSLENEYDSSGRLKKATSFSNKESSYVEYEYLVDGTVYTKSYYPSKNESYKSSEIKYKDNDYGNFRKILYNKGFDSSGNIIIEIKNEFDSIGRMSKSVSKVLNNTNAYEYEYLTDGTLITYSFDSSNKKYKASETKYKDNDFYNMNKILYSKSLDSSGNIIINSVYKCN